MLLRGGVVERGADDLQRLAPVEMSGTGAIQRSNCTEALSSMFFSLPKRLTTCAMNCVCEVPPGTKSLGVFLCMNSSCTHSLPER